MFYDIKSRFVLDVVTSYSEYLQLKENGVSGNGMDLRKGMEVATALYHFGEHLAEHLGKDFNLDLRADINRICPDYSILGNITNVHKHSKIDRSKPVVVSAKNIQEIIYIIEYVDDAGLYYHAEKGIEITLINGTTRNLLEILTNVINMWYVQMYTYKLIEEIIIYNYNRSVIHPRVSQDGIAKMDQIATRGLPFEQRIIFEKYNYSTGKLEVQDIPPYMAPLTLKNNLTKETVTDNVPLTEEENKVYKQLKGEKKRSYLVYLAKNKGIYNKLIKKSEDEWGTDKDFYLECRNPKDGSIIKKKMRFQKHEILHYERLMRYEEKQEYIRQVAIRRGVYEEMIQEAKEKWGINIRPLQERYTIGLVFSALEGLVSLSHWIMIRFKEFTKYIRFKKSI